MRYSRRLACFLSLFAMLSPALAEDQSAEAHKIPAINAGLGSCSVDLDVRDSAQNPVYAAKVDVRIVYGFMNLHKLDLEASTNVDGKLRFAGLPRKARQPLEFRGAKDQLEGQAVVDTAKECNSHHIIVLQKPSEP